MSDKTRRETATTGKLHPARHPLPRPAAPGRTAVRTVPRPDRRLPAPRGRRWPDARTAEALLAGGGAEPAAVPPAPFAPTTAQADRLVRLLSAARQVSSTLDPDREAAALAAFRDAAARRAGRAATAEGAAYGRGAGVPGGTLRAAFAVRRPRMMVAAVASALALGGVAVGMAAARTSPPGGGGSGTSPLVSRPPAAVSPDGGRTAPRMPAPALSSTPVPSGSAHRDGHAEQHRGRACGRAVSPLCPPAVSGNGRGAKQESGGNGDRNGKGDREDADTSGTGDAAGTGGPGAQGAVVVTGEILNGTEAGDGRSTYGGSGYEGFPYGTSGSSGAYGGGYQSGTAAPFTDAGVPTAAPTASTGGAGASVATSVATSSAARPWHGRSERRTAAPHQRDMRTPYMPPQQRTQPYG